MERLRVAIIGCGLIGHKRAKAISGARLVACADQNLEIAKKLSTAFGEIPFFTTATELLETIAVDIVILSTPHKDLPQLLQLCISKGKHVLVEKPAGRFAAELETLVTQIGELKIRIGFNHRYHRSFRKAKEIFDQGLLGNMMFIRGRYGHGGRIGYNKEWRADPAISGGGELIDQGSHLIDLSRMFLGDFTSVQGYATNYYWEMPVDDNAFLLLRTQKGQTAFLQASCTEWKNLFSFEIYGTLAKLDITGLGGSYGIEKLAYYKMLPEMGPPETTVWEYPMSDDSWELEFQEFITDILTGREVSPGLLDAIENLKIVNEIYKLSGYDYNT